MAEPTNNHRQQYHANRKVENRIMEMFDTLWDDFVDPREAYTDSDGQWWGAVGNVAGANGSAGASQNNLDSLRNQCRQLAMTNEFAINGHENRINYIVGAGHNYRVVVRRGIDAPVEVAQQVQAVLDQFLHLNQWKIRQQEIVRRLDRDGEVFLRSFVDYQGITRIRFIEPEQVRTPTEKTTRPDLRFGIQTDPHDVETVLAYYVDGSPVDASEIQHRKANVDMNVKRGLPLYAPVRKNLRRAEKLLRNMSVVAEIQSAIALIRKHRSTSRSGVEQFVADQADGNNTTRNGRSQHMSQYAPGTILDAPAGLEYDFPTTGVDAASFVTVLQAELRAVASRLVMPEFMFTSDASNSNFSSTMVAEGPAVKMFERMQATMSQQDCDILWRVIDNAIASGKLPHGVRDSVEIQITPPSVSVRDKLEEAKVNRIAYSHGILSAQSWSQRLGLDYDQEQKNRSMHSADH